MKQIFLDLDGVCADFDAKKLEIFGTLDVEDQVMWRVINRDFPEWFLNLPPMKDFPLLWEYVEPWKPIVLTATSKGRLYDTTQQKIKWVHKHMGPDVPVIVCMRSHKKDYASKGAILIDDREDNIEAFNHYGGIGILHKNAAWTITALQGLKGVL